MDLLLSFGNSVGEQVAANWDPVSRSSARVTEYTTRVEERGVKNDGVKNDLMVNNYPHLSAHVRGNRIYQASPTAEQRGSKRPRDQTLGIHESLNPSKIARKGISLSPAATPPLSGRSPSPAAHVASLNFQPLPPPLRSYADLPLATTVEASLNARYEVPNGSKKKKERDEGSAVNPPAKKSRSNSRPVTKAGKKNGQALQIGINWFDLTGDSDSDGMEMGEFRPVIQPDPSVGPEIGQQQSYRQPVQPLNLPRRLRYYAPPTNKFQTEALGASQELAQGGYRSYTDSKSSRSIFAMEINAPHPAPTLPRQVGNPNTAPYARFDPSKVAHKSSYRPVSTIQAVKSLSAKQVGEQETVKQATQSSAVSPTVRARDKENTVHDRESVVNTISTAEAAAKISAPESSEIAQLVVHQVHKGDGADKQSQAKTKNGNERLEHDFDNQDRRVYSTTKEASIAAPSIQPASEPPMIIIPSAPSSVASSHAPFWENELGYKPCNRPCRRCLRNEAEARGETIVDHVAVERGRQRAAQWAASLDYPAFQRKVEEWLSD